MELKEHVRAKHLAQGRVPSKYSENESCVVVAVINSGKTKIKVPVCQDPLGVRTEKNSSLF